MASAALGNSPALNNSDAKPNAKFVADLHTHADTDGSAKSIHHTLGSGANQAAPGNHTHDGGQSALLETEADTGWVDVPPGTGYAIMAAEKPQVRKIGNKVWMRGGITNTGVIPSAAHNVLTLPSNFYPPVNMVVSAPSSAAAAMASANLNATSGIVQLRTSATVGTYYKFDGISWLAD